MKVLLLSISYLFLCCRYANSQPWNDKTNLNKQDTLRGSITPERLWWDVLYYDISIQPDFLSKRINGFNKITYKVIAGQEQSIMQIDLQKALNVDSVILNNKKQVSFKNDGNVYFINIGKQKRGAINFIKIYYSGVPHEAADAPWDGGWIWARDSLSRPWMTVACQGTGASTWFPCKDHQSDEPDNGAALTITVPDTLVAVANGRLKWKKQNEDRTATYRWQVENPINNYNICPYIGKYVNISADYKGVRGRLEMNYWVLDYHKDNVQEHLTHEAKLMMKSFEHWLGPYPFYEDGYKLVEAPHLGMEHQSAVAYGNRFLKGYRGRDQSGTGWGLKWDFIIVHESAHEWFGNSITVKDPADKWIHESFACYADVLYMKDNFGDTAGDAYVIGTRLKIKNDEPIIGPENVNKEGSGDMYQKGRNMLHMIRRIVNDDNKFRQMLIDMNKRFYHKIITGKQIEDFINTYTGINFSSVFKQYLRTIKVPVLEYRIDKGVLSYRYANCLPEFTMSIKVFVDAERWLVPTTTWQQLHLEKESRNLAIDNNFYVNIRAITEY